MSNMYEQGHLYPPEHGTEDEVSLEESPGAEGSNAVKPRERTEATAQQWELWRRLGSQVRLAATGRAGYLKPSKRRR